MLFRDLCEVLHPVLSVGLVAQVVDCGDTFSLVIDDDVLGEQLSRLGVGIVDPEKVIINFTQLIRA